MKEGPRLVDAWPDRLAVRLAASLAARRAVSPVASEAWWERLGIITMARTIMIIIITITTIIINRGGQLEYELQRKRVKLTDDGSKLVEWAGLILSDKFRNDASCPTSRLNKSGALGEILAKSEDREGYRAPSKSCSTARAVPYWRLP